MAEFRYPHRIAALRSRIAEPVLKDDEPLPPIDGLIVSHVENARYLSGFTGSNALIFLTAEDAIFFTDTRYELQSQTEAAGFERVVLAPGAIMGEAVGEVLKRLGIRRAGFEASHMTFSGYQALVKAIGDSASLEPRSDLVEKVRLVKDADEIAAYAFVQSPSPTNALSSCAG